MTYLACTLDEMRDLIRYQTLNIDLESAEEVDRLRELLSVLHYEMALVAEKTTKEAV